MYLIVTLKNNEKITLDAPIYIKEYSFTSEREINLEDRKEIAKMFEDDIVISNDKFFVRTSEIIYIEVKND